MIVFERGETAEHHWQQSGFILFYEILITPTFERWASWENAKLIFFIFYFLAISSYLNHIKISQIWYCLERKEFEFGFSVNIDHVKLPIFPDFADNLPEFSPDFLIIFLDIVYIRQSDLVNHNFHTICIRAWF